jgi:hypothetical protein
MLSFGSWAVAEGLLSVDGAGLYRATASSDADAGAPAEQPALPRPADVFSLRLRQLESTS